MWSRRITRTLGVLLVGAALLALTGCFNREQDLGLEGGYRPPLIAHGLTITTGNDGVTSASSSSFTDPSADFDEAGVLAGDILEIRSGANQGEFPITEVGQNSVTARGFNPTTRESGVAYSIKGSRIYFAAIDGYVYALGESPLAEEANRLTALGVPPSEVEVLGTPNEADGFLYAAEPSTGVPRQEAKIGWRRPEGQRKLQIELVASPVLDRSTNSILLGSEDGNLYAYDAANGRIREGFPFQAGDKIWSTPAVRDGVIYFGSHDNNIYAVFLDSGEKKWEFATGGVVAGRPLVFRDQVIVGSFDTTLYSLDIRDGSVRWTVEGNNWFWAGAVTNGSTIFAPSMDGNIYALDSGGNLLWKHDMGSPIVSTPLLTPHGLVVAGKNGTVSVLDPTSRDIGLQRVIYSPTPRDADILAPITIAGDSIFVGAEDSTVSRLDLASRKQIWCFHTEEQQCE